MTASWDTSRYLSLFVTEATEQLEALSAELVRLEGRLSAESIDSLFRHAHSVKGMAGSMGFEATAQLSHRLEDLLDRVRGAPHRFDRLVADLVLQTVDALTAHVQAAAREAPFPDHTELTRHLAAAAHSLRPGTTPPPISAPNLAPLVERRGQPAGHAGHYEVLLRVVAGAAQPGVRGFLAYKRLSTLGAVSRCEPPLEEVKGGRLPQGLFTLELETAEPQDAVTRVISQVADVELVALRRATPRPGTAELPEPDAVRTVKVRAEVLDGLAGLAGEFLVDVAALRRTLRDGHAKDLAHLQQLVGRLHELVQTTQRTPLTVVTERLPRAARDIARRSGREIELVSEGTGVELDRTIVEALHEPVLHLLRNAIDHGVEPPEERRMRGKNPRGTVKLSASRVADRVVLEVSDDGRGMDVERLKATAVERGLLTAEAAQALPEKEALLLSTAPGLSTATVITDISGRGVGMDAVRSAVESIGGTLDISSRRGAGTTFRLSLPLTSARVDLLVVMVNEELYGLPLSRVRGVLEAAASRPAPGEVRFGNGTVPMQPLAALLGLAPSGAPLTMHVVVETDTGHLALAVEQVLGQEDVVLTALTRPLEQVPGLAGVTLLTSGQAVFVVDVAHLAARSAGATA